LAPVNYTDQATTACQRSKFQLWQIEGVAWSAQQIPIAVNFGFLYRNFKKKKLCVYIHQ
jgi:hypothetical protein